MLFPNSSSFTPNPFTLNGIPSLEALHAWLSLPFCSMYVIAVVGNCGLLYLICREEALHQPMYYFLAMLSSTDLVTCSCTVPRMLFLFWFNLREIDFSTCLIQMFFVHTFTGMESGVLMLMALDRYVAICYPLRYSTILTNTIIVRAGMATFFRGAVLVIPVTFLTKRLPFCQSHVIPHTYCDHRSVAKVSCGNIKVIAVYGLMISILIGGFDILFISASYTAILKAVVSLPSAEAQHKAFSTCTAHIIAIIITYVPAFFSFFTHRFGGNTIPHHVHIIIANLYLVLPPMMNPVVYGVKTKQIREAVVRLLDGKGGH
ncbi:olfactory receptor 52N2-like [Tachyglossus aculeatus]|uniref:olfactory receptor 52N2-like n=1 Tax=Tachyglossus aculeatus TaxID=9261 RepID=UPI0018F4B003|nr:olfactory receptor 52N2-like [Tachyglossus aculeatus]